jgi:hypothetical protein
VASELGDRGALAWRGLSCEAVMHLFSGAIGHAKNPMSHRDVAITAQEARLIIFASHLLDIVEQLAEYPSNRGNK